MPNYSFKTKILFSTEGVGPTEDKGQECSKAKRGKFTSIAEQKKKKKKLFQHKKKKETAQRKRWQKGVDV